MNLKIETDVLDIVKKLEGIYRASGSFTFEGETFRPYNMAISFQAPARYSIEIEFIQQPNAPHLTVEPAIQVVEDASNAGQQRMLVDPADELGKVWDVLHAAGINSGGELSASEGVKLLADKAKWAVPTFPQPKTMQEFIGLHMNKEVPSDPSLIVGNGCDHDWFAPYGQKSQQCSKCDAVRG